MPSDHSYIKKLLQDHKLDHSSYKTLGGSTSGRQNFNLLPPHLTCPEMQLTLKCTLDKIVNKTYIDILMLKTGFQAIDGSVTVHGKIMYAVRSQSTLRVRSGTMTPTEYSVMTSNTWQNFSASQPKKISHRVTIFC